MSPRLPEAIPTSQSSCRKCATAQLLDLQREPRHRARRAGLEKKKAALLVAIGVKPDGHKVVIAVSSGYGAEEQRCWNHRLVGRARAGWGHGRERGFRAMAPFSRATIIDGINAILGRAD